MQHTVTDIGKVQINQAVFFKNLYRSLELFCGFLSGGIKIPQAQAFNGSFDVAKTVRNITLYKYHCSETQVVSCVLVNVLRKKVLS